MCYYLTYIVRRGGNALSTWQKTFQRWQQAETIPASLKKSLREMEHDTEQIKDAFYNYITFGTGGMRGILGPGINRMNVFTVRRAVEGLARFISEHRVNYKDRGVVIGYDSRHQSREFALEAAKVLGVHGIRSYVFKTLCPTPLLSFAVRYFGATAGIMITASHNPPNYNGFKVYNEQGSQITSEEAEAIIANINGVTNELAVRVLPEEQLERGQLLQWVNGEAHAAYLEQLKAITKLDADTVSLEKDLAIVFTPLHGTALDLVDRGLRQLNFTNVHYVKEQTVADPNFSTVASPNPEEKQAFTEAIALGNKVGADILLATDPDADRLGVAVKDGRGEYTVLTGNELGCLLLDYILRHTDPLLFPSARMIKTVVTTELGRKIAASYGVETLDTLTGFKYIGEKINEFDATGETFIFGFEESFGYLINSFARDKDGVQATVMAVELAYYWQQKGKTLLQALDELYARHGYFKEGLDDLVLEGVTGQKKIQAIMETFRHDLRDAFGSIKTVAVEDYLAQRKVFVQEDERKESLSLPRENALKYVLEENCWVCLRPSGTEPKLKWYYGAYGKTREEVEARYDMMQETLRKIVPAALKRVVS